MCGELDLCVVSEEISESVLCVVCVVGVSVLSLVEFSPLSSLKESDPEC